MKIAKRIILWVALGALLISIFSFTLTSRRLPAGLFERRLLISTPLGTPMDDVLTFIRKKGWMIRMIDTSQGFPDQRDGYQQTGSRHIEVYMGSYQGIPWRVDITVYWGFNDNSQLVDIWVWKTADAL